MGFNQYSLKTDVEVQAEQLSEPRSIITPRGSEQGQEGDWEVTFPDGNVQRMTDEEWQKAQGQSDEEKVTQESGKGISSPGNVESETEETADEDSTTGDEEDSETDTETPEKPSRSPSRKSKADDERF